MRMEGECGERVELLPRLGSENAGAVCTLRALDIALRIVLLTLEWLNIFPARDKIQRGCSPDGQPMMG